MVISIYNDKFFLCTGYLEPEDFTFLTGKSIDIKKRKNYHIVLHRVKGHLYISDEKFIQGELYRHASKLKKIYKCVYVDNDGMALLKPHDKLLKAMHSDKPSEWFIA
jgi:hypothetical protein